MQFPFVLPRAARKVRDLVRLCLDEAGQDLIECAMLMSLVALGSTAGIRNIATGIGSAYGNIDTKMHGYISGTPSAPGQNGDSPGQSGNTPGQNGSPPPGQSGNNPGHGH